MIATGFGLLGAAAMIGWCAGPLKQGRRRGLTALAWVLNIAAALTFVIAGALSAYPATSRTRSLWARWAGSDRPA